jgi:protoporphyrinogen oxidase
MNLRDRLDRRQFLYASAGIAASAGSFGWSLWPVATPTVPGTIVGANAALGHRLRSGQFPAPSEQGSAQVVIIGGGIAGLSAAWKLQKSGVQDIVMLEMEAELGGNAQNGRNAVSAYPWGAHYVPLLTDEAKAARELFVDLGIITGYQDGKPLYNEYFLGADPHERLYMFGRWQEGLVPQLGMTAQDQAQYKSFFAAMEGFKNLRGADGKRAFAIPTALSSADTNLRALDQITMAAYMAEHGWDAPYLRWYVNYCCRDDYGAPSDQVSAWAGIHYFAARNGQAANADAQAVVTWPEGNGWIVAAMQQQLTMPVRRQALVYHVEAQPTGVQIQYFDATRNLSVALTAQAVIVAAPHFVAQHLLKLPASAPRHYSPWMVANITLAKKPQGKGARLAWDNMIYNSPLLGYVVATHQNLNRVQDTTVLTYYWPLDHLPPADARHEALQRPYEAWQRIVLDELYRIHPEVRGQVQRLDVWLWGHGMIRPVPGYIWNQQRRQEAFAPPIFRAHSDLSGISIFEEAQYYGVLAAEQLMTHRNHPFTSSL